MQISLNDLEARVASQEQNEKAVNPMIEIMEEIKGIRLTMDSAAARNFERMQISLNDLEARVASQEQNDDIIADVLKVHDHTLKNLLDAQGAVFEALSMDEVLGKSATITLAQATFLLACRANQQDVINITNFFSNKEKRIKAEASGTVAESVYVSNAVEVTYNGVTVSVGDTHLAEQSTVNEAYHGAAEKASESSVEYNVLLVANDVDVAKSIEAVYVSNTVEVNENEDTISVRDNQMAVKSEIDLVNQDAGEKAIEPSVEYDALSVADDVSIATLKSQENDEAGRPQRRSGRRAGAQDSFKFMCCYKEPDGRSTLFSGEIAAGEVPVGPLIGDNLQRLLSKIREDPNRSLVLPDEISLIGLTQSTNLIDDFEDTSLTKDHNLTKMFSWSQEEVRENRVEALYTLTQDDKVKPTSQDLLTSTELEYQENPASEPLHQVATAPRITDPKVIKWGLTVKPSACFIPDSEGTMIQGLGNGLFNGDRKIPKDTNFVTFFGGTYMTMEEYQKRDKRTKGYAMNPPGTANGNKQKTYDMYEARQRGEEASAANSPLGVFDSTTGRIPVANARLSFHQGVFSLITTREIYPGMMRG
jgi:hypothetical protein